MKKHFFIEDCTIGDMPMLEEPRKPKMFSWKIR